MTSCDLLDILAIRPTLAEPCANMHEDRDLISRCVPTIASRHSSIKLGIKCQIFRAIRCGLSGESNITTSGQMTPLTAQISKVYMSLYFFGYFTIASFFFW
jgi:hypothetical protein